MTGNRTTVRGVLFVLAAAGIAAASAGASRSEQTKVPRLIFPVVGPVTYTDDFGEPRGQGPHEGNDILAPKRALAVAAEAGRVRFHTTSARAGCMLYLDGRSGTTYVYVHLNNDLRGDDNRGKCVPGVAYARGLRNGADVAAGEPIAFVGDSGDAEWGSAHLHFEVHPWGQGPVSPYRYLQHARKLLFAAKLGSTVRLTLQGTVLEALDSSLSLRVTELRRFPGGLRVAELSRTVQLSVPPTAIVLNPLGALVAGARLRGAKAGQPATVWTQPVATTLAAQLGEPLALAVERIALEGSGAIPGR